MVLDPSDYNLKNLYSGGINPSKPVDMFTTLLGALFVLSVIWYAVGWSRNKGANTVEGILTSLDPTGVSSTSGQIEVFR